MKLLTDIEGNVIEVTEHPEHEYTLQTALVARGYGVSESAIKEHKSKHADELQEGKHWFFAYGNVVHAGNVACSSNSRTGLQSVKNLKDRNSDSQVSGDRNSDAGNLKGTNCTSQDSSVQKTHAGNHGGKRREILWTKRGIVRLGFFIKSAQAKRFRDAAEDLVIRAVDKSIADALSDEELTQALIKRGYSAKDKVLESILPEDKWGSLSANGLPKISLRRSCFVAKGAKVDEAYSVKSYLDNPRQLYLPGMEPRGILERLRKLLIGGAQ